MPYKLKRNSGSSRPWKIIKKNTGEVVGTSTSRAKAIASIKHRTEGDSKTSRAKATSALRRKSKRC